MKLRNIFINEDYINKMLFDKFDNTLLYTDENIAIWYDSAVKRIRTGMIIDKDKAEITIKSFDDNTEMMWPL